jgi:hypothetical protein
MIRVTSRGPHQSSIVGPSKNLLGFFDSFAVVLANEAPVPYKVFLTSDEIDPVILHRFCPRPPGWQRAYAQTADVDTGLYSGQPPNIRRTPGISVTGQARGRSVRWPGSSGTLQPQQRAS